MTKLSHRPAINDGMGGKLNQGYGEKKIRRKKMGGERLKFLPGQSFSFHPGEADTE